MRALLLAAAALLLAGASPLPDRIAAAGRIVIAVVPNYPPMEFRDPATGALGGFDIDLGDALARRLGVRPEWRETPFAEMIPALKTGRVDAILSGMSDIASRHDAARFVDYLHSGPQFFVQAARAGAFRDMQALCGRRVGASRRTSFPRDIAAWSDAHCAGNPVVVVGTEGSADARTQLRQGRIDAAVQGRETLPYLMAQEPGAYAVVGAPIATGLTGIAVAKDDAALQAALAAALDAMIADGSYAALLARWDLSAAAIEKATINAGQ